MDLSGAFEGLDEAFDTEFEEDTVFTDEIPEDDKVPTTAVAVRDRPNVPMEVTEDDKTMRDTDFVSHEIKGLIESSKSVLDRLDADIRIGSQPRMYEVYSQLTNSITAQLKELRQLHESVAKIKIDQGKLKVSDVGDSDKIQLTSDQLLDMIDRAKERSEIKEIDADFEVDDEDMLPTKEDDE